MNDKTLTRGQKTAADVSALLRARNPLLWIVTREEARVERLLMEAAEAARYVPRFWDCATGVSDYAGRPAPVGAERLTDPAQVLATIRDSKDRAVWILRDLPTWLRDPSVLRAARSLARNLPLAPRDEARAVIILTPSSEIPPELAGHAIVIEWPLPDRDEIAAILDAAVSALPEELRANAAPNGTRDAAIDAAVGLSAEEAQSCYARSLVQSRTIEPATVAQEKRRVIAAAGVLEWYDPLPGGLDAVGGLDLLKTWLKTRRAAFGAKARAYGLPAPKGVLLVGHAGCGKSLSAKAIGTAWQMPILRMDVPGLMSKWQGESGSNVRKALRVAEAVSPCVLWLDEIEKGLAGGTAGAATDGGTGAGILGTILTWMQERAGAVFVIATANDVSALPPELLRKGRFDDLFFIDLPTEAERAAVVAAALRQYNRTAEGIDLANVALNCPDFTGAELAALVPEALYTAFADGARPITTADLLTAARTTVPFAKTASEAVTRLRQWAAARARPASSAAIASAVPAVRSLDL